MRRRFPNLDALLSVSQRSLWAQRLGRSGLVICGLMQFAAVLILLVTVSFCLAVTEPLWMRIATLLLGILPTFALSLGGRLIYRFMRGLSRICDPIANNGRTTPRPIRRKSLSKRIAAWRWNLYVQWSNSFPSRRNENSISIT